MTEAIVKFEDFKVCTMDEQDRKELMESNLGDSGINYFDLDIIKSPSAKETEWVIPDVTADKGFVRQDELVGVILAWKDKRTYYEKEFGSGDTTPPDCSSDDLKTGIGLPGGDCATCEFAEWDSGKNGVGQACKVTRELLVLRPDKTLPCIVPVGPGSLGALKKYFTDLVSIEKPYWKVVTGISLVTTQSKGNVAYPKFTFRMAEVVADEKLDIVRSCRSAMAR
jgi:hypothetical protein